MSFKPSPEEQKWAKIIDLDTRKQMKEHIEPETGDFFPEIVPVECPNDRILLEVFEIDKSGIIIHKCSFCGGIWIDRINLERLFQSSKKASILLVYLAKILNIEVSEI